LGFTQLLELDNLSDDQSKSVQHILKAGRHLLTLINEVLDVARIETGTLLLSLEPINIEDILRETVTIIQPLAESHHVTVNHTHTGSPLWVMGDKQRLEQVMLNLLSNAIKYNIRDGRVTVNCYLNTDGNVRLEVKDTGIGIAGEKLSQLFTPFDRLGAEETSVEGIGIGLTLTKHLVEAMQGKIHVQSDLGKGTTMWVDLPKTYEGP
jgi:signal transduction histidine kinase